MILIRPHQEAAIAACRDFYRDGKRRFVVTIPTGTGKTITSLAMAAKAVRAGRRVLFAAHREELIAQTAAAWQAVAPDLPPAGIVKAESNETARPFTIASNQTLWQPNRLAAIRPETFYMAIIDEAHHAMAPSNRAILDALSRDCVVIGLTATVERADNLSLAPAFPDGIAYSLPLLTAIRDGLLVDFRHEYIDLGIDFDDLSVTKGDFVAAELEDRLSGIDLPRIVVDAIKTHASDRKGICFTCTVAHAETIYAEALRQGIPSAVISYHTDDDARRKLLHDFHTGAIKWVFNVAVLSEGFDEPGVDCIAIAKPTASKPLYLQQVGRGLRLHPTKTRPCLILDFAGAGKKHSPIQAPILFGIDAPRAGEGMAEAAIREAGERAARHEDIDPLVKALMKKKRVDDEDDWAAWSALADAGMPGFVGEAHAASLPNRGSVILWTRAESIDDEEEPFWVAVWLTEGVVSLTPKPVNRELAFGIGREMIRRAGAEGLADRLAPWRLRPPSDKLAGAARKWGCTITDDMNAGQVSEAMTSRIACVNLKAYLGFNGKAPRALVVTDEDDLKRKLKEQGERA